MSAKRSSRGHPLVALLAVLGGWAGGRAATWDIPVASALQAPASREDGKQEAGFTPDPRQGPISFPDQGYAYTALRDDPRAVAMPYFRYPALPSRRALLPVPMTGWAAPTYFAGLPAQPYPSIPGHLRDEFALSEPFPRFYAPEPPGMSSPGTPPAAPLPLPQKSRRWSADSWALVRRDSAGGVASPGALPATYGASQAGAVLRYRLALTSQYRPTLYMRTTSSIGQLQETSGAVGFSARPLRSFPVIAAIEGRLTDQGGKSRFQPAAMVITELPSFRLPGSFRGEAYAQAGYVAGGFATPFADGQFRADRALLRVGKFDTRLGAGVWGGAQKGAARLDAGPSATIAMPLGRGTFGRVAIDWRFRLAGKAVPESGPALTLSAGF